MRASSSWKRRGRPWVDGCGAVIGSKMRAGASIGPPAPPPLAGQPGCPPVRHLQWIGLGPRPPGPRATRAPWIPASRTDGPRMPVAQDCQCLVPSPGVARLSSSRNGMAISANCPSPLVPVSPEELGAEAVGRHQRPGLGSRTPRGAEGCGGAVLRGQGGSSGRSRRA